MYKPLPFQVNISFTGHTNKYEMIFKSLVGLKCFTVVNRSFSDMNWRLYHCSKNNLNLRIQSVGMLYTHSVHTVLCIV